MAATFQSTLPVRGATHTISRCTAGTAISIHAPREGSDPHRLGDPAAGRFQSTLPVRGATAIRYAVIALCRFQSTLPVRGATDFWG